MPKHRKDSEARKAILRKFFGPSAEERKEMALVSTIPDELVVVHAIIDGEKTYLTQNMEKDGHGRCLMAFSSIDIAEAYTEALDSVRRRRGLVVFLWKYELVSFDEGRELIKKCRDTQELLLLDDPDSPIYHQVVFDT